MSLTLRFTLKIPRKKSKVVPKGNGLIPQDAYVMLGGITVTELRQIMSRTWDYVCDKCGLNMPEKSRDIRATQHRSASLEHDARQPRLVIEADVPADKKTPERTEGAAAAVQAKHGNSRSAKRVQTGPTSSTSFGGDFTEPSALPCSRDDALVDNGAAAPKSCLSSLEMRSPTNAGGLLPTGKASTTTRITFYQLRLRFCPIEEPNYE